ncbi:MAG TPA: hypothetical protein PLP66_08675 [Phycisphaerae bacterium]|nr:hypothetical protein [Phycisphaerae bacterium]HQL54521.1 hypothetical protein [Phycisphaerae bacterium]
MNRRFRPAMWCAAVLALGVSGGCTAESTRVALETQRRADDVQQAVFDRQHEALCTLLYRDLVQRLAAADAPLTAEQRAALNAAWNDRDLIEFWSLQFERARALRVVGVDAKLYADQSVIDLLWKTIAARADRVQQGLATQVAREVVDENE